jgi:hypothetical protein
LGLNVLYSITKGEHTMKRLISCIVALTFSMILSTSLTFAADMKVAPAKPPAPAPVTEQKSPQAPKTELLDINTATEAELKALPDVGDTYQEDHCQQTLCREGPAEVKEDSSTSRLRKD